jgi:TRAP-type uncharacterized transport system fused permease subunit
VLGLTNRNPVIAIAFVAAVALCIRLQILTEWSGFGSIIALSIALSAWHSVKDEAGKARFIDVLDAFVVGAKYAISVGAAAATVGIIIGIVTLTGVGFKLSTIITGAAADLAALFGGIDLFDVKALTLFFTLVMTAVVCILLGCGIPTTANYLIMVTIAAPALAMLGVPQLVSHFFVFYYGVLADITPPVALAAYAGASMAGADPFKTGNTAFRLGLAKALVPFVFVYSPAMLIVTKGFTWAEFFETTAGCIVGIVMLAAALTGYGLARMPNLERLWLGAASILVISPSRTATLVGLAMGVPVLLRQLAAWRAAQAVLRAEG